MKIRTTEQLEQYLSENMIWRRRELTDLKFLIEQSASNRTRQTALIRAAVAMLYAHWEGFIKCGAEAYVEYVAMQRHLNSELADHFLAIAFRNKLICAQASRSIGLHIEAIRFVRSETNKRSSLPYKKVIRTDANLSTRVLKDILETLGFSRDMYEPRFHLIDSKLLEKRNHIAHGSSLDLSPQDYEELHVSILELMAHFKNQIENAATRREYVRGGLGRAGQGERINRDGLDGNSLGT